MSHHIGKCAACGGAHCACFCPGVLVRPMSYWEKWKPEAPLTLDQLRTELATHGRTCGCGYKTACESREAWLREEIKRLTPPEADPLVERITAYLVGGGLMNPDLADHREVRELLLDCRRALKVDYRVALLAGEARARAAEEKALAAGLVRDNDHVFNSGFRLAVQRAAEVAEACGQGHCVEIAKAIRKLAPEYRVAGDYPGGYL